MKPRAIAFSYNGKPVSDVRSLLARYGSAELQSPSRSTVFLLSYWTRPTAVEEFGKLLGIEFQQSVTLSFEHPVAVKAGRGKASFTDLLISSNDCSVAIEAKHSEPPYETVSNWLGRPTRAVRGRDVENQRPVSIGSDNRRLVLQGWLDFINDTLQPANPLTIESVAGLTYQVLHRTASVCSRAAARRAVVYQCFSVTDDSVRYYAEELTKLKELLKNDKGVDFFCVSCDAELSDDYRDLLKRWESLKPALKQLQNLRTGVRQGLQDNALLAFPVRSCRVTRIL